MEHHTYGITNPNFFEYIIFGYLLGSVQLEVPYTHPCAPLEFPSIHAHGIFFWWSLESIIYWPFQNRYAALLGIFAIFFTRVVKQTWADIGCGAISHYGKNNQRDKESRGKFQIIGIFFEHA